MASMDQLDKLGRIRLSESFLMREFLHSEVATHYRLLNQPTDVELAVVAGRRLCEDLLEPLQDRVGRISIRSAYRSEEVNRVCHENRHGCASNDKNYAAHIWDRRDHRGRMGATACIAIPRFTDYVEAGGDWRVLAWWIHDNLPYSSLKFFARQASFNIQWREEPERRIDRTVEPHRGCLTKPGDPNHAESHSDWYHDCKLFQR